MVRVSWDDAVDGVDRDTPGGRPPRAWEVAQRLRRHAAANDDGPQEDAWPAYAELNPEVMTASFQTLMQWYLAGAIKPHVSAIYPLAQSAEALDRVVSRKATGKIVIAMD